MKIRFCLSASLFLCLAVGHQAYDITWDHELTPQSNVELAEAYTALTTPARTEGREVSGVTLERPGLRLVLVEGMLFREITTILDGVKGYGFKGKALLDIGVEDPAERDHMKLFTRMEEWKGLEIDALYILPTGSAEPFDGAFEGEHLSDPAFVKLKNALHKDGFETLSKLFNRSTRDPRDLILLFEVGGEVWAYQYDSEKPEEMSLCLLGSPPRSGAWWWDPVLSQHVNKDGSLTSRNSDKEVLGKFRSDLLGTHIDMTLDTQGIVLPGVATLNIHFTKPTSALYVGLHPLLRVVVVSEKDGDDLPFLQIVYNRTETVKERGILIHFPGKPRSETVITFGYVGDLFADSGHGSLICVEEDLWYPRLHDADGSAYEIVTAVPEEFEVITIGDLVDKSTKDGRVTYTYRFEAKARHASLIIGNFRHHKETAEGIEVDVAFPESVWTAKRKDQEKSIKVIVSNCLKINSQLYGPHPFKTLRVGECGFGHGRGFPTLLLISALIDPDDVGIYQQKAAQAALNHALVAHETGHQWWGNMVEQLTYRDVWLSEGLAELAALDYAMVIYGRDRVREALEATEFNLDDVVMSKHTPVWAEGPILMGTRLHTTRTASNDYQTIVYNKTAWALINLRKIAEHESPKKNMHAFYNGLKGFLKRFEGKMASTDDFQETMEIAMGMKLDWFFDQYFRQKVIPTVAVTAKTQKGSAGWELHLAGSQDTDFRLRIPVQIHYSKDDVQEVLFKMDGSEAAEVFPLKAKPKEVEVDHYNEALARVKQKG